jgi:PKD repeat protein
MTKGFTLIAALAALAVSACTHKEDAPPLTGPSGFSTSESNTPFATFRISPNPVDLSQKPNGGTVRFDATGSCGVALSASGACPSPATSFQFAFSDGTTAQGPVVVRQLSDDSIGTLSALLVVTNSSGAAASATESAQVLRSPPPKASATFVPNPAVLSAAVGGSVTVVFADTSTVVAPRVIKSWVWDFLAGSPSTGSTAQHVFTTPGTFPVVLTITDDLGQQAQTTLSVVVTAPTTTPGGGTGQGGGH